LQKIFVSGDKNMEKITIRVYNIVGDGICVEAEDGQKIYEQLKKALETGHRVILSFQNVEMVTSAFLNTAVGQLYRDFDEKKIKDSLAVEDMLPPDIILLKRVVETAKIYYKDPERLKRSIDEILGD